MLRSLFLLATVSLLASCITTGEYLALKNDVNQLKRDYYSHDRDITLIKKDFGVVQDTSKKSVGLESFDAIRDSQEQMASQLSFFSKELQEMRGKVDESTYLVNKSHKERAEELGAIRARLDRIEKDIGEMNVKIAGVKPSEGRKKGGTEKDVKKMGPKALYEDAHKHLKKGDYKKARQGFQRFLEDYPAHALADNSQFWIGETYYREKDSENAIIEYQKLIKTYPDSPKIPSALYKQGLSFRSIGDENAAKVVFQLIVQKYPKSPEAKKARTKLQSKTKKKK